jgi:glycosyltransferase involved in cell wall biosynthesis
VALDRIHFLDGLSREELAACYAEADVFALPSTGEGFGLVFLEALAFAKPVIGTRRGGTTDLIEEKVKGLLVPPRDPERLTESIQGLLQNERLRIELGQRGAGIVRGKYRFDVFEVEFEKIVNECGLDSSVAA